MLPITLSPSVLRSSCTWNFKRLRARRRAPLLGLRRRLECRRRGPRRRLLWWRRRRPSPRAAPASRANQKWRRVAVKLRRRKTKALKSDDSHLWWHTGRKNRSKPQNGRQCWHAHVFCTCTWNACRMVDAGDLEHYRHLACINKSVEYNNYHWIFDKRLTLSYSHSQGSVEVRVLLFLPVFAFIINRRRQLKFTNISVSGAGILSVYIFVFALKLTDL